MDKLKESLLNLKNELGNEVHNLTKMSGAKFDKLCEDFCLNKDIEIYKNEYNLAFTSEESYNGLAPYLKSDDLVLSVRIPKSETYLIVYQYFNSNLLESYID